MTENLIDLRALLVERDEFEGSMVSKLREGLSQGGAQIRALRDIREALERKVAAASGPQEKKLHLKLGVVQFFLGHMGKAVEQLKLSDGPLAAFFLGRAHVQRGEYEEAIAAFDRAEKSGYASQQVQLQKAGALRNQGQHAEAKAILVRLKDMAAHNAEYHFQEGGLAEAEGDKARAAKSYERAAELDPAHTGALFRLAFLNDLEGNDYDAVSYYERCLRHPPVGKGVLYNLGVLYEDTGDYERAADCFKRLAKADPLDERARLFARDAEQSMTMHYNPDDEQVGVQYRQVMEFPITDLELSVRSRNCLKRMNVKTLGDLTRVTEPQLLTSKNFGDTSLDEIKAHLTSKGLRLGQSLEQGQQYEQMRYKPQPNLSPEEQAVLNKPVSELNLSVRARKCMNRLNVATLGDLVTRTTDELLEAKNFGITSLNEVKEKLQQLGLKLRGD